MTYLIIIVTAIVSISAFNKRELFYKLQFNAYQTYYRKEVYRLVSHGFVHADWPHLIFNMISFYLFAPIAEYIFQSKLLFLFFYLSAIVFASLKSLIKHKNDHWYNSVGASGGVSAIIFASILADPFNKILILPIPIPIPAIIFGVAYIIYSQYMSKKNTDNINHDAHFWGAVFGIIFTIALRPDVFVSFLNKILPV